MEKKMSAKELLSKLIAQHYQEALDAKAAGEKVVWATSIAPQELMETMGLKVVYPENHAAAIGARKDAQRFIDDSESHSYSVDLCSYARVNIGYKNIQESTAGNIPLPDILVCCNNICNTVIKWFENLSRDLKIPLILFDMPFNHSYEVQPNNIRYIEGQFKAAMTRLEELTGRKFDQDRFKEVMKISDQTARWWKKACSLAAARPSPMSGFDLFNYMAAIVCLRGKPEGLELFKVWAEELQEKIEAGQGPWKDGEEKFRIMWDGIACWPHLSDTYKVLKKNGINMVTSTYPDSWSVIYDSHSIYDMARAYSSNYVNRNLDFGVDLIVRLVKEFSLDGIVYHSNRSCKLMDFRQYEVQRQVQERTGIPSIIFDGDQTDPRAFSLAQYETRIQALVEMMSQKK